MPKEITIIQLLLDIYVHCQWELFSRGNGENKNGCEEFELDEREHISSVQSLSRIWLCDPMNRSTPGLPVHHQLLEFTQTHAHWVGDAIQPSHPLSSPSPPAPNPSQHQGLFQRVNSYFYQISSYFIQHPMGQTPFKSRGYLVKDSSHCLLVTLWPTIVWETETRTEQLNPVVVCFSAVLSSSQDSWFEHL